MFLDEYVAALYKIRNNSLEMLKRSWNPKTELFKKVDKNGTYKEFKGDTIVFFLSDEDKRKIIEIQNELYEKIGDILANKLSEKYFHMTLHDLCNYNITNDIEKCIKNNEKKVKKVLEGIDRSTKIRMKSISLYNGGSAIGIMFTPENEEDLMKILETRKKFDELIEQRSFYIPHVTLGYYLPMEYDDLKRNRIINTLQEITCDFCITLDFNNLKYTHFADMDRYYAVL
ncbi:MAG: hypothetical protein H0Z24_00855 [Thermosipho sp. (in: Bacteria)]|nr:hypothetical protein [Thermosipho sp. (in: thermotogales)]